MKCSDGAAGLSNFVTVYLADAKPEYRLFPVYDIRNNLVFGFSIAGNDGALVKDTTASAFSDNV